MSHCFEIVDVFAENPYSGNQLAVVHDAGDLTDEEMGRIANEMGFSETTFIESLEPDTEGYPVRIFTPTTELPFAGHPVLGTAAVLRNALGNETPSGETALSLGVGRVPVTVEESGERKRYWMRHPEPTFGATIDRAFAASVVGLDETALDSAFGPRVVSTGVPTLIVPVESKPVLDGAAIDETAYAELLDRTDAESVLVFAPETVENESDLSVRVFVPVHGVPEDPATGSSNGCLAAYLVAERYFDTASIDVRVEQGYALDRPSAIFLRAEATANVGESEAGPSGMDVRVGGGVVPVARGELLR